MFNPRSAIPIAIQSNVLRNSTFLAASFHPNMKGLTVRGKNGDITMARLFYMNDSQVGENGKKVYYNMTKARRKFSVPRDKYFTAYNRTVHTTCMYTTVQQFLNSVGSNTMIFLRGSALSF